MGGLKPSQLNILKELKIQTPAKLQSEIEQLKNALPLPDLMEAKGYGDCARSSCQSPLRDDHKASFGIFRIGTGWLFKDHGSGDSGDELQFIASVHGLDRHKDFAKIMEIYRALAKSMPQKRSRDGLRVKDHKVNIDSRMFLDAVAYKQAHGLLEPPAQFLNQLEHTRPYGAQGLMWAAKRGVLKCKTIGNTDYYYVVDKTGLAIERRRLDEKPFKQGMKSKSQPGSRKSWPVGILEASKFRNIALVEGIPDFLIAHEIIQKEQPEPNCAPVAMLGASSAINQAALPYFTGKYIRIFAHDDAAGQRACLRWQNQLLGAGCSGVEIYGLGSFEGVNDLYDYWKIHRGLMGSWMPNI